MKFIDIDGGEEYNIKQINICGRTNYNSANAVGVEEVKGEAYDRSFGGICT